ncbi:zinc finger BED domain-containing protein 5-like [Ctenocephalides felis]|uniref:zinc finger BED domain-containing protein 5-like n=1 Tax=Ctenocephalides felis TaxID=7515 RepID=UPI000E6E4E79|nr:zinc finger BED domain-containing protein 5-like [Ctenocephalides felis]
MKSNNFDMFPPFKTTCVTDETEARKDLIINHMTSLRNQFAHYFKDLDMSKYEWIRNPFVIDKYDDFGLPTAEQKMIIDLSSDSTLKQMFQDEKNIVKFWLQVNDDFPTLTTKALEILLPFVTSYLCEIGFSAVAVLKTKYRSRLVIEKEPRTAISTMELRFEKICAKKQAQPSH